MAPKRRAASAQATDEQSKRYKQCVDDTAEELVCPITFELPVDPVTAEDGRVYERRAIEDWIARPGELKSPTANTPMGPRLLPATQVRNIIDRMVRTGSISGPKAEAWSKKLAEEAKVKAMRERAEGGDGEAMYEMGELHYYGKKGVARDYVQSARWFQRGHDVGHVKCTTSLGFCYEYGEGVEEDATYALYLYVLAAKGGSEKGCNFLALSFDRGEVGLSRNAREATRWFRAMESAEVRDASERSRAAAADWLRENAVE